MNESASIWEPQELHSDLTDHVRDGSMGKMLHHPLLINILLVPGHHNEDNQVYLHRKAAAERARVTGNWSEYVFWHERPYRAEALRRVLASEKLPLQKPASWKLIKSVWTDSENVQQHDEFWASLWAKTDPRVTFNAAERKALDKLPEMIPIWHGLERNDDRELGYSWTTDKAIARRFAERFAGFHERAPYLAAGRVRKEAVKAYLLERGESEIIAFPEEIERVAITRC
ncbi:MAG: hypothetical protein EON58_18495 [Alphaproteobacteria bacterium]|nr:MAG: hypothetical protein EON58_18495 [Alphaproteobacteria bacterium]